MINFLPDDKRREQKEHSSGEPKADLVDDASLVEECKRLRDVIHTMSIENDALRGGNVNLAKQVTEREDEIEILLKKLTSQVNASTTSPWVKDVIDSNVHMKLRLQMTERDNKDLADECLAMSRVIQKKTDQVHSLKQLVQSLQVQVEREGNFKDALEQKKERSAAAEAEAEAAAAEEEAAAAEAEAEAAAAAAAAEAKAAAEAEAEADNEDLRVEIQELKELVEFLEMEKMCSMEEEKANAAEKSSDQIDKISLLVKQNAILKEQVEAWREGFAMKIKKEAKLLVQLTAKKDVCAKLGRLVKRQQTKRKAIERKCSKMAKRPKTTTKVSPKMNTEPRVSLSLTNVAALNGMSATKEIVTNSLKQNDNCKHEELELVNAINDLKLKRQIEDLEERNQELAELVEFLELERKCTLEENEEIRISDCQAAEKEIERIRISMMSNYDELINDYEEEKQRRMYFEKLLEQTETKLQGTKERFDNEFQKNLELETKLLKMEETAAGNSSKWSLNCFQRIFRRGRRRR